MVFIRPLWIVVRDLGLLLLLTNVLNNAVLAAGEGEAPGPSVMPSSSFNPAATSDLSPQPLAVPEPSVIIPPFIEPPALPEYEYWHIYRSFRSQLAHFKIDHDSLIFRWRQPDQQIKHAELLRRQLQAQIGSKHVVPITTNIDFTGKICAIPIYRDVVKEALTGSGDREQVGWAVVGIWRGQNPKIVWYGYALLHVGDRTNFLQKLQASSRVKVLADLLRPVSV